MNTKANEACSSLASLFCKVLGAALSQTCNLPWQVASLEEVNEDAFASQTAERYQVAFGSPLAGRCILSFQSSEAPASAGVKSLSGEGGPIAVAVRDSVERLKGLFRPELRNLSMVVESIKDDDALEQGSVLLSARLQSEATYVTVQLAFDAPLLAALNQPALQPLFPAELAASVQQPNLDLVMDVPLDVTLRFGRRQLPLREIIDLASGSVVELDRQVDEPIELVLDGRVIARGEAVIIDGNYGIRVTQIVQPLLNA